MKERDIVKKIRTELLDRLGVRLHKATGGPYGEIGASDLYGTLPGGRAVYVEVKMPGKKGRPEQVHWLEAEAKMGAVAVLVTSWDELQQILSTEGYLTTTK